LAKRKAGEKERLRAARTKYETDVRRHLEFANKLLKDKEVTILFSALP
jgi:hypothetical protein